MAGKKMPRCSMLKREQYAVNNPAGDEEMAVTVKGDEPLSLMSDAGALDDVEVALFGTIHFVVLARNKDAEYMGIEVFDAETGEKIAEAFTDDKGEIKDIAPSALRETNPTRGSTVMKRMYPYAMGHKKYKPKARANPRRRKKR